MNSLTSNILVTELAGINFTVLDRDVDFSPTLELAELPSLKSAKNYFWFWAGFIATLTITALVLLKFKINKSVRPPTKKLLDHLHDLNHEEWLIVLDFIEKSPLSKTEREQWAELRYHAHPKHSEAEHQSLLLDSITTFQAVHPEWFHGVQL